MDALQEVVSAIRDLEEDMSMPKNVRAALSSALVLLNEDVELSIKASKAMHELELLAESGRVQSEVRMEIFNIVSLLESI